MNSNLDNTSSSCHEFRSLNSKKRSISTVHMTNQRWGPTTSGTGSGGGGAIANALRHSHSSASTRLGISARLGFGTGGVGAAGAGGVAAGVARAGGVTNAVSVPALSAAAKNSLYNSTFGGDNDGMQNASFDLQETVQQAQSRRIILPTSNHVSHNIFLSPNAGLHSPSLHGRELSSGSLFGDDIGEIDLGDNFAGIFDSSTDLFENLEREEKSGGLGGSGEGGSR